MLSLRVGVSDQLSSMHRKGVIAIRREASDGVNTERSFFVLSSWVSVCVGERKVHQFFFPFSQLVHSLAEQNMTAPLLGRIHTKWQRNGEKTRLVWLPPSDAGIKKGGGRDHARSPCPGPGPDPRCAVYPHLSRSDCYPQPSLPCSARFV